MFASVFALIIILISGFSALLGGEPDYLCMFWNVENLFEGKPHFRDKCNGIAKTIMLAADEFGGVPDFVGLAEVENRRVVEKLVNNTVLRGLGYGIIHFDSPDHRGIDCALLYRRDRFRVLHAKPCNLIATDGSVLPTRDILLAVLAPEPIAVLVNHHPSKVGAGSDERRAIAMGRLMFLRDSLLAEGIGRIIAIGDFNEEVKAAPGVEATYPRGSGTIKFQGKWEKIDGCPVLEGLTAREHIFAPPHLSTPDTRYSGIKPLRTFSGPRYLGGLSDHYPIILEVHNKSQ